ncbi:MAG: calcium-binding protein, partial [Kofleriaceae bacterium]
MKKLLLVLVVAACDVGEVGVMQVAKEDVAKGVDPCQDTTIKKKINIHADKDNPHRFVGTNGDDVIFGTSGDDQIFGNGGDDLICGFAGDDYIDGGDGNDRIFAGAGDDIVHGRAGSDKIWGGAGADILFGDTLDDELHGEAGNDILIGGDGTDILDGGDGNDFLRGDTGNDTFIGGDGNDIASFATALPPGQPEIKADNTVNPITGVRVTFEGKCDDGGCADGDGGNEPIHGIEKIIGSPFTDLIVPNGQTVQSGFGETVPTPVSTVFIDAVASFGGELIDVGVVVLGSPGADHYHISGTNADVVTVVSDGTQLTAMAPCNQVDANTVKCNVGAFVGSQPHRGNPFHYILGWGDKGDDDFTFSGDFPREFETHVSGGEGNDHLVGGAEADVFFTGTDGVDHLEGNDGDDALIGESHHTRAWDDDKRPNVADYHDGGDTFDGGPGNDQLVVDYVCGGHTYIGGPGRDIAGFARSGKHAINAQLGGPAQNHTTWYGKAANLDLCGSKPGAWTDFKNKGQAADLEILEASDGPDHLWGDDRSNTIWGRGGGDHIFGLGGDDTILGADG